MIVWMHSSLCIGHGGGALPTGTSLATAQSFISLLQINGFPGDAVVVSVHHLPHVYIDAQIWRHRFRHDQLPRVPNGAGRSLPGTHAQQAGRHCTRAQVPDAAKRSLDIQVPAFSVQSIGIWHRQAAMELGKQAAAFANAKFPAPINLQFEKVLSRGQPSSP